MSAPKQIGIAVVEHERRYLVGIRGPGVPLAGFAEFPGGKCAAGEPAADCAQRECLEETGLQVSVERLLQRLEFEYPHGRVDLHFFLCHPLDPVGGASQQGTFRWVTLADLKTMQFPEANADVINLLD
jgi:8-oxo-dGTP diphosphatase